MKISQTFVAFSEYMNFTTPGLSLEPKIQIIQAQTYVLYKYRQDDTDTTCQHNTAHDS